MQANLLLVEDDPLIRRALASRLRRGGYRIREAETVAAARTALKGEDFDAALLDYRLPDGTGLEILDVTEREQMHLPCIVLTAHASVQHAVEAMRRGAFTYLSKPIENEELDLQIRKAIETRDLQLENRRLRRLRSPNRGADAFLGTSRAARQVRDLIQRVAQSPARAVLLQGESGTGKGVVARAIHEESDRHDRSFVPITCSAVPDNLLETELFGHEAGAFTDARKRKMGLVEAADAGTLFLDEIGDMPGNLQAKLLGVLEENRFRRVGGIKEIPVDVRVVSATHRDLDAMVREGTFREDLLYRLRVIPIVIPPLRERPEDIPVLAEHFAREIAAGWGRSDMAVDEEALEVLAARPWPGNVRELRNAIERAVILASGRELQAADFQSPEGGATSPDGLPPLPPEGIDVEEMLNQMVRRALERTDGNQSASARLLGLSRDQVRYRMQKMGLLKGRHAPSASS